MDKNKDRHPDSHQSYLLPRPSPSESSPEQASSQCRAGYVCFPTRYSEPQVRKISAKDQSTDIKDKLLSSD